jgi:acyl-CoA dehydrogenase
MEFEFSAEQQQLKDQVRRFLADRCDRNAVRAVLEGEQPFDRPLWKAMGELGYLGASIPEA